MPNTAWFILFFGLRLPVNKKKDNEETGIAFDFLADSSPKEKVITGHDNGVITLNIEEADEAARVRHKQDLGEKYRTLLGHFRHEIGHYYWETLIKNTDALEKYRLLFGDEETDYPEALEKYYKNGAPPTGASILSVLMQPLIPGKTGRKPGRTICI